MIRQVPFFGKGKSSAFKIAIESEEYAQAFSNLGNELDVPSKSCLEKVCMPFVRC